MIAIGIECGTNACNCMHVLRHDAHSMHPRASIRRPGRPEAWFGQKTLQPPGLKEQLASHAGLFFSDAPAPARHLWLWCDAPQA